MELTYEMLPGLFHAADHASVEGQRRYLKASRLRLALAVLAAVAGAVTVQAGGSKFDIGAAIAAAALVAAAFAEIWLLTEKPEQAWYDGRAVAESAKTLAWRYAVGGAPFPKVEDEAAASQIFIDRISELLQDAPPTNIGASENPAITDGMRQLRGTDLTERRRAYMTGRIDDQQRWYAKNSKWNNDRARAWRFFLIAVELAGVIAALLRAFGIISIDLASIAAAMIAAGAAWLAIKQHDSLGRAYAFASNELGIVRARLELVQDEEVWVREVADAEEAMSREHTMWRASRSSIPPPAGG